MARHTLQLAAYRVPFWRRRGLWLSLGLGVALAPAVAALGVRLLPDRPAPEARERPPQAPLVLRPLSRPPAAEGAWESLALSNAFSPDRKDWAKPPSVETAGGDPAGEDRLKLASDALDRLTFVGVIRVADEWKAMVDPGGRKPGEDYLMPGPGEEVAGWTVKAVSREGATLGFEETERVVAWGPKPKPVTPAPGQPTGRLVVDVREAPGAVLVDPPISIEEARRRLHRDLTPGDENLRRMLDELLESLKNERRSGGA